MYTCAKNYVSKLKLALIINYKLVCQILGNFDNFRATDATVLQFLLISLRSISSATPTDLYNNQLAYQPAIGHRGVKTMILSLNLD